MLTITVEDTTPRGTPVTINELARVLTEFLAERYRDAGSFTYPWEGSLLLAGETVGSWKIERPAVLDSADDAWLKSLDAERMATLDSLVDVACRFWDKPSLDPSEMGESGKGYLHGQVELIRDLVGYGEHDGDTVSALIEGMIRSES